MATQDAAHTVESVTEAGLIAIASATGLAAADPLIAALGVIARAIIDVRAGKIPPLDADSIIKTASGEFGADDTELDREAKDVLPAK